MWPVLIIAGVLAYWKRDELRKLAAGGCQCSGGAAEPAPEGAEPVSEPSGSGDVELYGTGGGTGGGDYGGVVARNGTESAPPDAVRFDASPPADAAHYGVAAVVDAMQYTAQTPNAFNVAAAVVGANIRTGSLR